MLIPSFFKFHYVSINSNVVNIVMIAAIAFKFHYVSINSATVFSFTSVPVLSLNSIIFLLIHLKPRCKANPVIVFKFHYVSINSMTDPLEDRLHPFPLNSIMFLLIPVPKPTAYLLHETPLFCRPLQNISFLSHSSSYVLATPPILAIFYFCRFPAFFTLSQVDRNHYIFIISSFLLA